MTVNNNDILKVVFEVALDDGSIAQNVYYFVAAYLAPQADLSVTNDIETWVEGIYGNLTAEMLASMTQNICSVHKIVWSVVKDIWETSAFVGYFTPTITWTNATDGLPNQTSAFATFNTYLPGHRGRKFMMPFGEDMQADSYITAGALSSMVDYADDALDNIVHTVGSELIPGVPSSLSNTFLQFAGAVVTNVLGSQRRRRPGVGA